MLRRAVWAQIDLGALRHNYREIKKLLKPETKLCAVVKADAYGHGALAVAKVAIEEGADYLAVASVDEGLTLRKAGFTEPILILGLAEPEAAPTIVAYNLTQTVCRLPLVYALSAEAARQKRMAKVHLKIETGMGRIGVYPEEAARLAQDIASLPNIEVEGAFSHFAAADEKDKSFVKEQQARFQKALEEIANVGIKLKIRHLAESAAILEILEAHYDMVRAGIIQYGLWPSSEVTHPIDLHPVMSVWARISYIKEIDPGDSIGYGRSFIATKPMRVATVPIGYADGYLRAYGKGYVMILGKKAKILGRICMDQCMVDVSDIPEAKEGTPVMIFGAEGLQADDLATWADTINYEVVCLISARVPRVYGEKE